MSQLPRAIRAFVTLGFASAYVLMVMNGNDVPAEFYGLVGLTIGFYFKEI